MNNTIVRFSLVLMFLGFIIGCGDTKKKEIPQSVEIKTDIVLDSFFKALHDKGMFNGAVGVKKEGKLILKKGYGTANFSMETPFLAETAMEVASVSKQFTAFAILLLEQEKKLSLEDHLQKYLGDDFPYANITIKHILTHTSGLPDYESHFRKTWDTTKIATNSDIVRYFKLDKPQLISQPGTKYHYSNSGYILLAEIVHAVSGKPLDEYLKDQVFDVAEMKNTAFYDRDEIWKLTDYAPGYLINPETCQYDRPEDQAGKYYYHFLSGRLGSGRLSSSVDDLIKWDSILYTNRLLHDKGKELTFQAYPPKEDPSDYGFGWHIVENDSLGKVVYHTGSWAGNLAYIKRYLDDKSLVVILNNTYSPYIKKIRKAVDDYLNGKPLQFPQQIGIDILKKEICHLNKEKMKSWYEKSLDAQWHVTDLESLSKQYTKLGLEDKAALVDIITNFVKSDNQ
ncbi:serine hydrolase domain-containing protein [Gelidibacter japonicus]|uniref:serine hydrolase domain-containing protein n=1 Tax=Gelidibacter japonicus TaxID=1962232 RepID=UPI0013D7BC6A|nr:serine hydrolase domain-containing protein [Gelidibacter japonicus]